MFRVFGGSVCAMSEAGCGVKCIWGDGPCSWVSVEGLCEVICGSLYRPELAGLKLLVADPRPLSTPQTVDLIARALGKNALLIPVPVKMLRAVGRLVGRSAEISRLVSSLEVDATQTFEYFEWKPEWCFEESVDDLCAAK